jgi:hypothetical protein
MIRSETSTHKRVLPRIYQNPFPAELQCCGRVPIHRGAVETISESLHFAYSLNAQMCVSFIYGKQQGVIFAFSVSLINASPLLASKVWLFYGLQPTSFSLLIQRSDKILKTPGFWNATPCHEIQYPTFEGS